MCYSQVADVKRFNGLSTDLQMFALKTLRIPTPGRHPPSSPTQFKLVQSPLSQIMELGRSEEVLTSVVAFVGLGRMLVHRLVKSESA